jgi:hypothetical protein
MATNKHALLIDEERHAPYRQIFANAAARLADATVYVADDLYKTAYQSDTSEVYVLTDISPVWTPTVGGSFSGAFITASNVTSNSPGDQTTDDFVFGSDSLDDDGDPSHDSRMLFDKSRGAFRAGETTSTSWDESERGSYSLATGIENSANSWNTVALGQECLVESLNSAVLSGYQNSIPYLDRVDATDNLGSSWGNVIAGGTNNDLNTEDLTPAGLSTQSGTVGAFVGAGINNRIDSKGVAAFIGAGKDNRIVVGAKATSNLGYASAIVAGDGNSIASGADAEVAFIGAGQDNSVVASHSSIVGGNFNLIGGPGGTHSFIGGGDTNEIAPAGGSGGE